MTDFAPLFFAAAFFALMSLVGAGAVRRVIRIYEAKHELKQGSAGYLRSVSGWIWIILWIAATWFGATVLGDWWTHGDLEAAMARGARRLELLIILLDALSD